MMKSRLFLLLWMCCSVLLTACENDEPTPQPPVEGSRTVLAYLASDNSLSSFALADLEARCIVAVAGMEGALPSVIGGLADCPEDFGI